MGKEKCRHRERPFLARFVFFLYAFSFFVIFALPLSGNLNLVIVRPLKTKATTLANHNRGKEHNEPIRTWSNQGREMGPSNSRLFLVSLSWLVEKVTRVFWTNQIVVQQSHVKANANYFRRLKTALSDDEEGQWLYWKSEYMKIEIHRRSSQLCTQLDRLRK